VLSPISRPYWIESDDQGRIIFNEQTANNISVMDPKLQSLVEYHVPSKNPYWGDCDPGTGLILSDCGLAQIFDFTVDGNKIWFTEWVENNIGVVDTSIPLPIKIKLEYDEITLTPGDSYPLNYVVESTSQDMLDVSLVLSSTHDFLNIDLSQKTSQIFQLESNASESIPLTISASEDAVSGTYKILLGSQSPDIAVSKFVTVTIE
jgi:virginiamycin B lyase